MMQSRMRLNLRLYSPSIRNPSLAGITLPRLHGSQHLPSLTNGSALLPSVQPWWSAIFPSHKQQSSNSDSLAIFRRSPSCYLDSDAVTSSYLIVHDLDIWAHAVLCTSIVSRLWKLYVDVCFCFTQCQLAHVDILPIAMLLMQAMRDHTFPASNSH